jgi:hypothetical protein
VSKSVHATVCGEDRLTEPPPILEVRRPRLIVGAGSVR